MKDIKDILGVILFLAVMWHIRIAFSSEKSLTGIFKQEPEPGYVWKDSESLEERFFWQSTDVIWKAGQIHPQYNVSSTTDKNDWVPLAGYEFTTQDKGNLSTIWKAGLKHPNMNAYSTENEGKWSASVGYRFIMQDGLAVNTEWDSGKHYDDFKIIASEKQDTFRAYPGYLFKNPSESLDVVWTPGLQDPENHPYMVSGIIEGTWEYESSASDNFENAVGAGLTGGLIEWVFGKNPVSDKLYEVGLEEGINGIAKTIK